MSDEERLLKDRDAGYRAKTVIDDPAFQAAYKAVRDAIVESWEQCPIRDREGAHELKLMLKIHKDIEGHLRKAVEQGVFATKELARDKTIPQRIAERLRIA